jgi:hypothetical protein
MATTTVTLYRNGNTTSPRLDNVRDSDVVKFKHDDEEWVRGRQKGISTFDATAKVTAKIFGPRWWILPEDSAVVDGLYVLNDNEPPGHWLFQPDRDMPLATYIDLLRQQQKTAANDGQWEGPTGKDWPGPGDLTTEQEATLSAMAANARTGPVPLSPKAHDFLLIALDQHIERMEAQIEEAGEDEDTVSDLTNDLVLYSLIRQHLADRGPQSG